MKEVTRNFLNFPFTWNRYFFFFDNYFASIFLVYLMENYFYELFYGLWSNFIAYYEWREREKKSIERKIGNPSVEIPLYGFSARYGAKNAVERTLNLNLNLEFYLYIYESVFWRRFSSFHCFAMRLLCVWIMQPTILACTAYSKRVYNCTHIAICMPPIRYKRTCDIKKIGWTTWINILQYCPAEFYISLYILIYHPRLDTQYYPHTHYQSMFLIQYIYQNYLP